MPSHFLDTKNCILQNSAALGKAHDSHAPIAKFPSQVAGDKPSKDQQPHRRSTTEAIHESALHACHPSGRKRQPRYLKDLPAPLLRGKDKTSTFIDRVKNNRLAPNNNNRLVFCDGKSTFGIHPIFPHWCLCSLSFFQEQNSSSGFSFESAAPERRLIQNTSSWGTDASDHFQRRAE